jgi:hypothetical protein
LNCDEYVALGVASVPKVARIRDVLKDDFRDETEAKKDNPVELGA